METSPALPLAAPPVFRLALPVLVTTFINKCGAIGLSLLPMLLVELQVGTADASLVMGLTKGALVAGTFLGGAACDHLGLRFTLLASFLLSGLGLGLLPWGESLAWVGLAAVTAQLGSAMFHSPARLMVTRLAGAGAQQEAIGWLRGAANCGQIVCYGMGVLFAGSGLAPLMYLDAATSLGAVLVGSRLLPVEPPGEGGRTKLAGFGSGGSYPLFLACAGMLFGYSLLYDLYMVGAAARFRTQLGEDGLRLFSQAMVINTVLCTAFAVKAARYLKDPAVVFPAGLALTGLGAALGVAGTANTSQIFLGAAVMTAGEVMFLALAQFTMMRVTPASRHQGKLYGGALVIQALGRILGSALAFPLVAHGEAPGLAVVLATAPFLALTLALGRPLRRVLA